VADVVSVDDVALNKLAAIERCVRRIAEVYAGDDRNLRADLTRQDSIILNIQRAAESAIDLAMHLVRREKLGIPQDSRDAFSLLVQRSGLDPELGVRLQRMVGFRNVAVHDYQAVNLEIVRQIILHHLDDLVSFGRWGLARSQVT
jgi:uncharacterized protein YutE (UPF0331/DUF86 family)